MRSSRPASAATSACYGDFARFATLMFVMKLRVFTTQVDEVLGLNFGKPRW